MANWISKATDALRGDDSSPSAAFELECECGQRHTGLRRQKWQRIVCRACGGALFVLQRDPYPPPKDSPDPRPAHKVEELEEVDVVASKSKTRPSSESRSPAPASTPRGVSAAAPVAPRVRPVSQGFWKPFRLVIAGALVLSALTIYFVVRNQRNETARRTLQKATTDIEAAIAAANWVEARNVLREAVDAAERLGQTDANTRNYRQLYRETTVLTDLLATPLTEMLDEADATFDEKLPDKWDNLFRAKYQRHWLFVEGTAVERPVPPDEPDLKKTGEWVVELPLVVGRKLRRVELIARSPELDALCGQGPTNLILAVRLDQLSLSPDGKSWLLRAAPDESVIWSDRRTYEGLGYQPEESLEVAPLLDAQKKSLGLGGDS